MIYQKDRAVFACCILNGLLRLYDYELVFCEVPQFDVNLKGQKRPRRVMLTTIQPI